MITKFVIRDPITRKVTGYCVKKQPGYAEEELPENHPDILEYEQSFIASPKRARADALILLLIDKGIISDFELENKR
jgi:hypothetical protein